MPRKRGNKNRLSKGYWFLGNDNYAFVNLWHGGDWKERVNCIGFVVLPDDTNYIGLPGQGAPEVVPFLEKVVMAEGGFERPGMKNKWIILFY